MERVKKKTLRKRIMLVLFASFLLVGMALGAVHNQAYADLTAEYEVRYSTDGGSTWKEGNLLDVLWINEVRRGDNVQIELQKDIVLNGEAGGNWSDVGPQAIAANAGSTWVIDGKGHKITRGAGCKGLFFTANTGTVTMKNITIDGGAVWGSTDLATRINNGIELNGNDHLIWVDNGGTLILESGVTLQNSDLGVTDSSSNYGAAITVGGTGSNSSTGKGTLIIKDGVKITGNRSYNGGAIYVYNADSELRMEGGEIYGNSAFSLGGAVCNTGTVNMTGGRIYNNYAKQYGGGICSVKTINMEGGKIDSNQAGSGGGILFNGTCTISNGEISENRATGNGGGISASSGNSELNIEGGQINNNNATNGGGVYCVGTFKMKNASIDGNQADTSRGAGGGVYLYSSAVFNMESGTINSNQAASGAGVYNTGNFTMKDGQINNNEISIASYGGGVFNTGEFAMVAGEICNNKAQLGGGIMIYNNSDENAALVTISGGSVKGNTLTTGGTMGGGICVYNGSLQLSGKPVITGNIDINGDANDVYLRGDEIIDVPEPFSTGAKIGVKKKVSDVPVAVTGACPVSNIANHIFSDNELYYTTVKGDNAVYLDFNSPVTATLSLPDSLVIHVPEGTDTNSYMFFGTILDAGDAALGVSVDEPLEYTVHYNIHRTYDSQNKIYKAKLSLLDKGKKGWYISDSSVTDVECPVVFHSINEAWEKDEINHWHTCSECDEKFNTTEHSYGSWETVREATRREEGLRQRQCTVCGYQQEEAIEKLPYTDAEKVADAKVVVEEALAGMTATNETVKADIQTVVDNALVAADIPGVTVTVGDLVKEEATNRQEGSIGGSISITCGNEQDSVTIDKEIEALPYTDAQKVADAKAVVAEVLAGITATNEITKIDIQSVINDALTVADIPDVAVTVGDLVKEEATKKEAGSVNGSISITCGSEQDSVTVEKIIEKLPYTDAQKVADAKAVVEEALAGITATNEITKADIQTVIDNALTAADILDVTVTVGDLVKEEATKKEAGSIGGNISIICGSEQDSITIDKTIEKLPYTDAQKAADAKAVVEEALAGMTVTNETTKADIQTVVNDALTVADIPDVTVTVGDLVKEEATKKEAGSIGGNISIICGSEQDSVTIDKTIEKLPYTDAQKVADAKAVIEEALAGMTVTNETTKADIQTVVNDALTVADIPDVTVTVGDLVKEEATKKEAGSVGGSISIICGSEQDSVTINKTIEKLPHTDEGKIETDKEQGTNTPDTSFGSDKNSIINAVLTPEEQHLVENGTDIKIILTIDNIDESVEAADKQAVVQKAQDYTVGQYLDINLYKLIGTDRTKVSHTDGKIKIVLAIPDSLKNTDSNNTRSYAVVRVHNGVAEVLLDTDNDAATVTIETDQFSTYALVYKDTSNAGSEEESGSTAEPEKPETDAPETGDETPVGIYAVLAMVAGLICLWLIFGKKKKSEQKKRLDD